MTYSIFDRRKFILTGVYGSMTLIPLLEWTCKSNPVPVQPPGTWIEQMVHYIDEGIPATIKGQITDPSNPQYGGSPDAYEIYNPHAPAGLIQSLTSVYISPSSSYYHDTTLIKPMILGIDYILRHQHTDGTIDLVTTNFHSTPDNGFIVELIALSYKLLLKDGQDETMELRTKLKSFLIKAGDALTVGGIHTPNHRWVVSMALARLNELFPNEKYVKRINQWLYEKIDIDADGQYNERSTSVYDPLTNRWLITIATLMNKPELYEPVRRNLDMTQYLIHPNGDLVTEMSKRQDQYSSAPSTPYIFAYHHMAIQFNEEKYKVMAAWIKSKYGVRAFAGYLPYFLEYEKFLPEPISDKLPLDKYEKYFEKSKLVRWRDGNTDATLVAQNSNLFSMHHEGIILQAVRCATAFFGKGQFIGDRLEKTNDGYMIHQKLEGPYFQPYAVDSLPADGDWDKMPREKRPQSEVQYMEYTLNVHQVEQGFKLNFSLKGTEGVPVAIELSFKNNGEELIN
ncbi:MAG: hypothetical protein ABI761_16965, partial [Saprospiraceae bacterium]